MAEAMAYDGVLGGYLDRTLLVPTFGQPTIGYFP